MLEFGINYWDSDTRPSRNDSLVDFGLSPIVRLQFDSFTFFGARPFIEGGVGFHVFTDDKFGDKDFGIPFAFAPTGGAGVRFGVDERFELAYRYQHLSNAGLSDSNPGIDFHLLRLSYHF